MIFKIQRPIFGEPTMFYYNCDRSVTGFTPMTKELSDLFGSEFKLFVDGHVINRELEINKVVEVGFD